MVATITNRLTIARARRTESICVANSTQTTDATAMRATNRKALPDSSGETIAVTSHHDRRSAPGTTSGLGHSIRSTGVIDKPTAMRNEYDRLDRGQSESARNGEQCTFEGCDQREARDSQPDHSSTRGGARVRGRHWSRTINCECVREAGHGSVAG